MAEHDDEHGDNGAEEDFVDAQGKTRCFRLRETIPGLFVEAVEVPKGRRTGLRFLQSTNADGTPPWGPLRGRIRERLARRDLVKVGGELQMLTDKIRGQLEAEPGHRGPMVIVDDMTLTWAQLGKLLERWSGFGLRLEVCEPGEE